MYKIYVGLCLIRLTAKAWNWHLQNKHCLKALLSTQIQHHIFMFFLCCIFLKHFGQLHWCLRSIKSKCLRPKRTRERACLAKAIYSFLLQFPVDHALRIFAFILKTYIWIAKQNGKLRIKCNWSIDSMLNVLQSENVTSQHNKDWQKKTPGEHMTSSRPSSRSSACYVCHYAK